MSDREINYIVGFKKDEILYLIECCEHTLEEIVYFDYNSDHYKFIRAIRDKLKGKL